MGFPDVIVECAFNNAADETLYATQGWAEITPWVKSMSGPLRGRQYEIDRSEAGTLTVVLDNTDGEFTPNNATSPFYPSIKSNRRFRVRGKNMIAPNVARGGGADQSTLFFERPTWSGGTFTDGVSESVWKQHDPADYPALPAELTDHIEVTVAPGTYTGFRRLVSWIVPVEIGVRLTHSAYVWKVSGTEPGGTEGRFEVFYFDNDDVDIIGATVDTYGLNRPMERYTGGTPTVPTRKSFSHAPVGTAKYARVVWAVFYGNGTVVSAPITYAITGVQSELPPNLAPNPNGDWDAVHWLPRGGTELPSFYIGDRPEGGPIGGANWVGFKWGGSVSLRQNIPHLTPGEWYAVTGQVNLTDGHPPIIFTADAGQTGPEVFRFPNAIDNFDDRTLPSSWGSTSGAGIFGGGGHAWTIGGTGTASVASATGRLNLTTVGPSLRASLDGLNVSQDWDVQFEFKLPATPVGGNISVGGDLYHVSGVSEYGIQVVITPAGTMVLQPRRMVGGANTFLASSPVTQTFTAGTWYQYRLQRIGNQLRASVTLVGVPPVWELTWSDEAHTGNASLGVRASLGTGNTNTTPYAVEFDNVRATNLIWNTVQTYFQAGGPDQDIEFLVPEGQDPTGKELLVRGLNVQRVSDPSQTVGVEGSYPTGETDWERPMDIFEGWIERWPWKIDEDETTITVVDRLKRVGAITLANVVTETLSQDDPTLVVPFNDDPGNTTGAITWSGSWAQSAGSSSLTIVPSKGDILTSSYALGQEGPTEEPAIDWAPASNMVGYHIRVPFSPDFTAPPTPQPKPPPSTPPPPPATVRTYTKTYYATWSRSYDSDGTVRWDDSPYLYHGCYFCSNNQRALVGFNWSAIKADLAGASLVSVHFVFKNAHARWNRGLSTHVGTHNYSSKPGSWSGSTVRENRWKVFLKEMEKKSISLGTGVGNEFKAGTTKGIAIGPAPSDITDNYGFFYGASHSAKPYLTISYKK